MKTGNRWENSKPGSTEKVKKVKKRISRNVELFLLRPCDVEFGLAQILLYSSVQCEEYSCSNKCLGSTPVSKSRKKKRAGCKIWSGKQPERSVIKPSWGYFVYKFRLLKSSLASYHSPHWTLHISLLTQSNICKALDVCDNSKNGSNFLSDLLRLNKRWRSPSWPWFGDLVSDVRCLCGMLKWAPSLWIQ